MELSVVGARLSALIVVIGVTAGCGGDPPTPPPFTPSTSVSSPTSTAPTEPVLPEAAKEPTAEGAKAFAEFYWEMGNYAQATGDTKAFRALASVTCTPCDGAADAVDDIYSRHGVIRGGEYSVSRLRAVELASTPPRYLVKLRLHNAKQIVDFPGTRNDGGFDADSASFRFFADFLDGKWLASHWESEK